MSVEIQDTGQYTYAQRAVVQPAGLPLEATVYIAVHWLQGYDLEVSDDRIKTNALHAVRVIDEVGNLIEALRKARRSVKSMAQEVGSDALKTELADIDALLARIDSKED